MDTSASGSEICVPATSMGSRAAPMRDGVGLQTLLARLWVLHHTADQPGLAELDGLSREPGTEHAVVPTV